MNVKGLLLGTAAICLAFGVFLFLEAKATMASPDSSLTQKRIPIFEAPRVGESVSIPERDVLGRELPSGDLLILSIPDCNQCSSKALNLNIVPKKPRTPIVLTIGGEGKIDEEFLKRKDSLYIVMKASCELPTALQYYANTLVVVDASRKIRAFASDQTSRDFIRGWK